MQAKMEYTYSLSMYIHLYIHSALVAVGVRYTYKNGKSMGF